MGRPSDYTPELAEKICQMLADGHTLAQICLDDDMPARGTIHRWLNEDDKQEFRDKYARARELQADTFADMILSVAFDKQGDVVADEHGNMKPNHEFIARSRLKVDALKWHAAKTAPKKYGDKIEQTIQGGDPDKPVRFDLSSATHDEVMDFIRKKTHGDA